EDDDKGSSKRRKTQNEQFRERRIGDDECLDLDFDPVHFCFSSTIFPTHILPYCGFDVVKLLRSVSKRFNTQAGTFLFDNYKVNFESINADEASRFFDFKLIKNIVNLFSWNEMATKMTNLTSVTLHKTSFRTESLPINFPNTLTQLT